MMYTFYYMTLTLATHIGLRQQPTPLTVISFTLIAILVEYLLNCSQGKDRMLLTFMCLGLNAGLRYLLP